MKRKFSFRLFIILLFISLSISASVHAQQFRGGSLSWKSITGTTVEFTISLAYVRSSSFSGSGSDGNPVTGDLINIGQEIMFGDGSSDSARVLITAYSSYDDWWYGEGTIQHEYASAGQYTATLGGCCKLSGTANRENGDWTLRTVVDAGSGNSSPVIGVPVSLNMPGYSTGSFSLPSFDPDGDELRYSLADTIDMVGVSNPSSLSIDSVTGVLTWVANIPSNWNLGVKVSDGRTGVIVDFTAYLPYLHGNYAPKFSGGTLPADGSTVELEVLQEVSYNVVLTDSADFFNFLMLYPIGAPAGAEFSPSVPVTGGTPTSTTFSWTPAIEDTGKRIINFIGKDYFNYQARSSIIVNVTLPDVTALPADSIGTSSASLLGLVNSHGSQASVFFVYGTAQGVYDSTVAANPSTVSADGFVTIEATVTGLEPARTHYYKVMRVIGSDTTWSGEQSFTTLNLPAKISISPASLSATLSGADSAILTLAVANLQGEDLKFNVHASQRSGDSSQSIDVLILKSQYSYDGLTRIQDSLLSYSDINSVSVFDLETGTPSLADLQNYDAVLVIVNTSPADPVALGEVLADYSDAGGGVVLSAFTFSRYPPGMEGRIMDADYAPLTGDTNQIQSIPATMYHVISSHPILEGVSSISSQIRAYTTLAAGADLVAYWSTAQNFIAARRNIVCINMFLGETYINSGDGQTLTGDFGRVVRNSLVYAAIGAPWVTVDGSDHTVSAGDTAQVTIQLNADQVLEAGQQTAYLTIESNDPVNRTLSIPVTLQIPAPDIDVTPPSFTDTLTADESIEHTITIKNDGGGALTYRVFIQPDSTSPAAAFETALSDSSGDAGHFGDVVALHGRNDGTTLTLRWEFSQTFDIEHVTFEMHLDLDRDQSTFTAVDDNGFYSDARIDLYWSGKLYYTLGYDNYPLEMIVTDSTMAISIPLSLMEDDGEFDFRCSFTDVDSKIDNVPDNGTGTFTVTAVPCWFAIDRFDDKVKGGKPSELTVTVSASGLSDGGYTGKLFIDSNDGDESSTAIPVSLVVGTPEIAIASDTLRDTIVAGSIHTKSLTVTNTGTAPLAVSISKSYRFAGGATPVADTTMLSGKKYLSAVPLELIPLPSLVVDSLEGSSADLVEFFGSKDEQSATVRWEFASLNYLRRAFISLDIDQNPSTSISTYLGFNVDAEFAYAPNYGGVYFRNYITSHTAFFPAVVEGGTVTFTFSYAEISDDGYFDYIVGGEYLSIDRAPESGSLSFSPLNEWFSAGSAGDTLSVGETTDIDLSFDATFLSEKEYAATLNLVTNDPDERTISIPVVLVVRRDSNLAAEVEQTFTVPMSEPLEFTVDGESTAVAIKITDGSGTASIQVQRYLAGPDSAPGIIGTAAAYRWIVTLSGLTTFSGEIRFRISDIPNHGIVDPATVVIYSRPTPGSGTFTALPTSYDSTTNELVATITSFSEFTFGSPGDPLPITLSGFTSFRSQNDVELRWTTVSENGTLGFFVERRDEGSQQFLTVSELVPAAGTSLEQRDYSWRDVDAPGRVLVYRLRIVDQDGSNTVSHEVQVNTPLAADAEALPTEYSLDQNFPNPFNPVTIIRYQLPQRSQVTLKVYDIFGGEVATLVDGIQEPGVKKITFDPRSLASGVYLYRLRAENFVSVKKMLFIR